ncbi:MAG: site-specific integrase, partial [Xanthobacteraceae bacterium]
IYSKVVGQPLAEIPFDLAAIRKTLDGVVPLQAKVSRKRWANLRSDIAAAIAASGVQPMLKTSDVKPNEDWDNLLQSANDTRISNGLSRFARWATLREVRSVDVDGAVFERFFAELEANSLVRNLSFQRRKVAKLWNRLVAGTPEQDLKPVEIPAIKVGWHRIAWNELPKSFGEEIEECLAWCAVPDPLDENARPRALAPQTLRLRRHYIHLAATAACDVGIKPSRLTSLRKLVEPDIFRSILRQQWQKNGGKPSAHLLGLANELIALASEWVKASERQLAELKKLRSKLGSLRHGLTEKNQTLLRRLEDPRLLGRLVILPDQMWRRARRNSPPSAYWFVDLQTALAIDILLHAALRIEDLEVLRFDEHIHWPQGKGKPALLVIRQAKVPNSDALELELPAYLSDRLYKFRNEIAADVIGRRPDVLFVSADGTPRKLSTLRVAIQRAILRRVGLKITPHQFRHLAGKIHLDAYPNAHESLRQFLGHTDLKTTMRFYAGPNTRRAGRAHAELIKKLRERPLKPRNRSRDTGERSI